MENKSMTALISAFARAYHSRENKIKVFDDFLAFDLLSKDKYSQIAQSMIKGKEFFLPNYEGSDSEALRLIVNQTLANTTLSRSAYTEEMLKLAVEMGTKQYLILASGYDSFAYRQTEYSDLLSIFEVDRKEVIDDKLNCLTKAKIKIPSNTNYIKTDFSFDNWINDLINNKNFNKNKLSFCSLLGVTYYLTKEEFQNVLNALSSVLCKGSTIVFDYPNDLINETKQSKLAQQANEEMKATYNYDELEKMLEINNFLIYEHLQADEITERFFKEYNEYEKDHLITAEYNVDFCLAVKKD